VQQQLESASQENEVERKAWIRHWCPEQMLCAAVPEAVRKVLAEAAAAG
jgi:hypothetical protein